MSLYLRQVALVASKLAPVIDDLSAIFGIEPCHVDPGVGAWGLENTLIPVGSNFLEVVAPIKDGTAAGRYIARRDGDGGYMVICQTESRDSQRSRQSGRMSLISRLPPRAEYRACNWAMQVFDSYGQPTRAVRGCAASISLSTTVTPYCTKHAGAVATSATIMSSCAGRGFTCGELLSPKGEGFKLRLKPVRVGLTADSRSLPSPSGRRAGDEGIALCTIHRDMHCAQKSSLTLRPLPEGEGKFNSRRLKARASNYGSSRSIMAERAFERLRLVVASRGHTVLLVEQHVADGLDTVQRAYTGP